jgi:PPOX class probable F420-dependent enzyme
MTAARPAIFDELLAGPYPCCLTTLDGGGNPYSVVVWCGPHGELVAVNATESVWLNNLRRDPRASLLVVDTANILRYVSIRGRVSEVSPDRDYAHINSLSEVYEGRPYGYSTPEDVPRFRVTITVERLRTTEISAA